MCPFFKCRQDLLKWNGWGYKDSKFVVNGVTENTTKTDNSISVGFTGNRYHQKCIKYAINYS